MTQKKKKRNQLLIDTRLYNLVGADHYGRPRLRWDGNTEIQLNNSET